VGAVQEIHDRERALILRLAKEIIVRWHDREEGEEVDPPVEVEWGKVTFRAKARRATIVVSLSIEP
jgi:hypothetical protein